MIKLINFINLDPIEKEIVLKWRNHHKIKSVMHNTSDISLQEHLNFIDSLKVKTDKKYFLVKEDNTNIGVIDFINIKNNEAELGIYTNPLLRGYGNILLNEICNYAFKTLKVKILKAEVYSINTAAIKLYKKFKFEELKKEKIDNKEIIFMELRNENR